MTLYETKEVGSDSSIVLSDVEIIEDYFPYWEAKMHKTGQSHHISKDNCIADYLNKTWTWELANV